MLIRLSRPDDTQRLFEIWQAAVDATHYFLKAGDRRFFAGIVRDHYLPKTSFWVAVGEDDRPLAFMGMTGDKMDALFVDPAVHGEGIGRRLVDHAMTLVPKLKVDVNEQNEGAAAFYERLGFVRAGRSSVDSTGRPYPILHLVRGT